MTTIRATCPVCGEVDMSPEDIHLAVREGSASYRFLCPTCGGPVEKRADRKVVALLVSAGVPLEEGRFLDLAPPPPFTEGDVEAFHRQLEDDGELARFASGV